VTWGIYDIKQYNFEILSSGMLRLQLKKNYGVARYPAIPQMCASSGRKHNKSIQIYRKSFLIR